MSKSLNLTSFICDTDGDGFPDALLYPIALPVNPPRDTVAAATELAVRLARGLLAMPERPWTITSTNLPPAALYLGPADAPALPIPTEAGFHVVSNGNSLLLVADDPTLLLTSMRHLFTPLKEEGSDKKDVIDSPGFGLGVLFKVPSRVIVETTNPKAVDAAARLALEQFTPPLSLNKPRVPTLHLSDGLGMLNYSPAGSVRVSGEGLIYLAQEYPHLPGGSDLTQLEHMIGNALALRFSHAQVAALLAERPPNARTAHLPHPSSYAHAVLHVPVRDSASGTVARTWEMDLPWEGRRLQERLKSLALPPRANVDITATLGESPEVRAMLAEKLTLYLGLQGHHAHVTLRSTLKPALCWLREEVLPQARTCRADVLIVHYSTWREGGLELPSRWLCDLYPLDALLERDFPGVKLEMHLNKRQRIPYRVVALRNGRAVLSMKLKPPTTERPYLPEDKRTVHPVCGWLTIRVNKRVIVDEHISSDAEMFWDWYQQTILQDVTALLGRKLSFGDLRIRLGISEPDEPLNVLHERLSGIEALHEDIYFVTLDALKVARKAPAESRSVLTGRIVPIVTMRSGRNTRVKITLTSTGTRKTSWVMKNSTRRYVRPLSIQVHLTCVQLDTEAHPTALSLVLHAENSKDATSALARLATLHKLESAGHVLPWELALPCGVTLRVTAMVNGNVVAERTFSALPVPAKPAPLEEIPNRNLTPHESTSLTWRAGVLPHVHVTLAGRSYQERSILALELTYPPRASQRKLAVWKPTLLLTARQHANEVSSTNAALALARDLAIKRQDYLKHMNVIIVPLENPDGAHLYSELAAQNPEHLLHAARYTALGADLTTATWEDDHPLSEGHVRRQLWVKWQPIVHLNDHGYPAHEWQQPFAGTIPYLFPGWSMPFGVFTKLIYTPLHSNLAARFEDIMATLFDKIEPEWAAWTQTALARWKRYQGPNPPLTLRAIAGLPFQDDIRKVDPKSTVFSQRYPDITPLTVITEVPDEGVNNTHLAWCVRAHRAQQEAVLRALLKELNHAD